MDRSMDRFSMISHRSCASVAVNFRIPISSKMIRKLLPFDDIYAEDWRHPNDPIAYWKHKARKCAEVLVPNVVDPKFVTGAYVVDASAVARLTSLGFAHAVTVDRVLFFR
jgi:ssDNA thymidine ADP-ribosyltransferase, DarT